MVTGIINSFDGTEAQRVARCGTVSAVVATALTDRFHAGSFGKLPGLSCCFCMLLQTQSPHNLNPTPCLSMLCMPPAQDKCQDIAQLVALHFSVAHSCSITSGRFSSVGHEGGHLARHVQMLHD